MLRIHLTSDQRAAVEGLRRDPTLRPAERDRVEILLLAAAGWTVPRIAEHFGRCQATVRRLLHGYAAVGVPTLRRQHPGPQPDRGRQQQVTSALDALLAQDRTWTAAQLAEALRAHEVHLSTRQVRRYLAGMRARWRRTVRTLRHKQDPVRVAEAAQELAALKEKAQAGELTLAYLDECGFSPSQPVTYSWTAAGTRKRVPYENPAGRRVNAIGILVADGPEPLLLWDTAPRSLTSHDLLAVLPEVPRRNGRLVLVLDNGSIHVSRAIKEALPGLEEQGVEFSYLPPYSPELNAIEPVFGGIKHHGLPERRYTMLAALMEAIDTAFREAEARLLARHQSLHQLRPAA